MPHLVLARIDESLDWLDALAPGWQVTVYQAEGHEPLQADEVGLDRAITARTCPAGLPAAAVMADAILQHVQSLATTHPRGTSAAHAGAPGDVTVFAPGHVLDIAPDFPALLDLREQFADVQPLSMGTGAAARLAQTDARDWLAHWPVRAERYSLATLVPLTCADDASLRAGRAYRRKHLLDEGDNVLAHFLSLAGLDDLASDAAEADLGVMVHGPAFAVSSRALQAAAARWGDRVDGMRMLLRADHNYPQVFLQAWLHLFGEPFIALPGLARPSAAVMQPVAPTMERVVASIDAVLAQAEPLRRLPRAVESLGPPVLSDTITPPPGIAVKPRRTVAALRDEARRAAATGDLHTAWARLDQALQLDPQDIEALADASALAYQQGDTERAMHCARRALTVDPQHLDCLFTLGMCLAAQGHAEEALLTLSRVGQHPQAAAWQAAHPDLGDAVSDALSRVAVSSTDRPGITGRAVA